MLMSQNQFARQRREMGKPISQQAISKKVRRGELPVSADGRLDSDIADAILDRMAGLPIGRGIAAECATPVVKHEAIVAPPAAIAPAALESPVPPTQPSLTFVPTPPDGSAAAEQVALTRARREKLEFEMAARRGERVLLSEVEKSWSEMVTKTVNRLMLIPHDITDPTLRAQVDRLIRKALAEIAQGQLDIQEESAA